MHLSENITEVTLNLVKQNDITRESLIGIERALAFPENIAILQYPPTGEVVAGIILYIDSELQTITILHASTNSEYKSLRKAVAIRKIYKLCEDFFRAYKDYSITLTATEKMHRLIQKFKPARLGYCCCLPNFFETKSDYEPAYLYYKAREK